MFHLLPKTVGKVRGKPLYAPIDAIISLLQWKVMLSKVASTDFILAPLHAETHEIKILMSKKMNVFYVACRQQCIYYMDVTQICNAARKIKGESSKVQSYKTAKFCHSRVQRFLSPTSMGTDDSTTASSILLYTN